LFLVSRGEVVFAKKMEKLVKIELKNMLNFYQKLLMSLPRDILLK